MENNSRISFNSSKNSKPLSNIISSSENNIFNSILFFDLDLAFIKSNDNLISSSDETPNIIDEDINNKSYYLIKELIKDLDSIDSLDIANNIENKNKSNFVVSLGNKGYNFFPRNYKNNKETFMNKENEIKSREELFNKKKINNFLNKKKNIYVKERKGDWICQNCFNLNFSFRTICNKCKGKKEECLKRIIE